MEGEKHVMACAGHRTELDLAAEGGRGSHQKGLLAGIPGGLNPQATTGVDACQGSHHPFAFLLLEHAVLHAV